MPRDDQIRTLCARVIAARHDDFYAAIAELEDAIDSYLISLPEFPTHAACPECGTPVPIAHRLGARFAAAYCCPNCEAASVMRGENRQ